MAKVGITQVTTAQTFQTWLDRTNELVTLMGTDVMTASVLGDTTTGNATLVGSFTANTVIANDLLRANTISPKDGSTSISITNPVTINSTAQTTQTLSSNSGPRSLYSSGALIWTTGFENTSSNRFIINTGSGAPKLALSPAGDLTVAGSINLPAGSTVNANLVGNVTGNVTGDVIGQVSDISNHDTDDLAEGSTNLYFTTSRARASISAGTGISITNGAISIGQPVAQNSNVTFNSVNSSDFKIGEWKIDTDETNNLCFYYNGDLKFRFTTNGAFIAEDDITAFGGI